MLLSSSALQKKVDEMCLRIGAKEHSLNLCTAPIGDGTPYISFENNQYNYIYYEKGYEFSRRVTKSLDELLYWIMYDFIHAIAIEYELINRIPNKDSRRIYFPKIIELMNKINTDWGLKAQNELNEILVMNPYDDKLYSK